MSIVDVIIPTYNGLPYLRTAVESVLMQSVRDVRLLIVDDGSTDETRSFVEKINDDRVTYLPKSNGGPSSARNLGIEASSAPYVAFLDSDDVWEERKLERQLALIAEGHGIVYCHQTTIDEMGVVVGSLKASLRGRVFDELLSGTGIVGSDSSAVVPRPILQTVGGFDERLWFGEDWDLWLRIAKEHSVDFVPEHLVRVRVRERALQSNYRQMAADSLRILDIIIDGHGLHGKRRRQVAETCLSRAIVYGFMAGERRHAWQALRRLMRESPTEAFAPRNWPRYRAFLAPVSDPQIEGSSHR